MKAVSVSAAFEMLFVIYLLHHTRVSSSFRVYALCKCSWRRPSLVQYFTLLFAFPCFSCACLCCVPPRAPRPELPWLDPRLATMGEMGEPGYAGNGSGSGVRLEGTLRGSSTLLQGPFLVQLTPEPHPGRFHIFISHVQRIRCVLGHAEVTRISSGIGTLHLGRMTPPKPHTPHTSAMVSSQQRRPSFIAARSICNRD